MTDTPKKTELAMEIIEKIIKAKIEKSDLPLEEVDFNTVLNLATIVASIEINLDEKTIEKIRNDARSYHDLYIKKVTKRAQEIDEALFNIGFPVISLLFEKTPVNSDLN